jgi:PD-(D/E)XK endonuclease
VLVPRDSVRDDQPALEAGGGSALLRVVALASLSQHSAPHSSAVRTYVRGVRSRLINRRRQGDLGEASAIEWLTRQGATVLIPFGHSPDYDLVAEIGGELLRVQVKTSTFEPASMCRDRWSVQVATNGGNQSWSGCAKRFDPTRVDYVFVLVGGGRRWLIPATAMEARNAITLGGTKYSEFEIEPSSPISQLVYGDPKPTLESKSRPGEYPSGQRTAPVKRQAHAFAGSNPASPTGSSENGDTTRFERSLGRSGQALVRPKRQTTIPKRAFMAAGLRVGDRMRARADGTGRIVFERIESPRALGLE